MSGRDQLIDLFSKYFVAKEYCVMGKRCTSFKCPFIRDCKVKVGQDPIWSPAFGDDGAKVMVVAEAPSYSKRWGAGPNIGGFVKDWGNEKGVNSLIRFIKRYHGVHPHFTDVMKCGISRQTKDNKKVFIHRIGNCVKQFLLKEIEYLQPEIIYSVGAASLGALAECKEDGEIFNNIEVVPLLHYSKQAGLPLTPEDKENIIWPFQARKESRAVATRLKFFQK